jgi:hypothetical protein
MKLLHSKPYLEHSLIIYLGAAGLVGYTGKGIYQKFQKEHALGVTEYIMAARIADGLIDVRAATMEEEKKILDMWRKTVKIKNK